MTLPSAGRNRGYPPKLRNDLEALDARVAANQADSTATTVADLKTDVNALLAKLKAAGLMVAD